MSTPLHPDRPNVDTRRATSAQIGHAIRLMLHLALPTAVAEPAHLALADDAHVPAPRQGQPVESWLVSLNQYHAAKLVLLLERRFYMRREQ